MFTVFCCYDNGNNSRCVLDTENEFEARKAFNAMIAMERRMRITHPYAAKVLIFELERHYESIDTVRVSSLT